MAHVALEEENVVQQSRQTKDLFWVRVNLQYRTQLALAVGKGKFWVRDPFVVRDPNHGMGVVFRFSLFEIVL